MSKVMVVAPHPDDETLGCGGTILKHKASGDEIYWLIMTNITSGAGYEKEKIITRQKEIDSVTKGYGFETTVKLDFPTARLDVIPRSQVIESISTILDRIMPDVIYIPNRNDVHSDHKVTFDAVISSAKTFRCSSVKRILMYEVLSETEFSPALSNNAFIPNSFSDISGYLDKKNAIMEIYKNEMGDHPFPRSRENLKALATFRGAIAGVKYAEAFMILKEIW